LLAIFLAIVSIYTLIFNGKGWGGVAAIATLAFVLILFIIDYILKKVLKKYIKIFVTELIIFLLILIWYYVKVEYKLI
jgi:hypothetical protein